ncbi:MAG: carboxymuconolactone decarboxylase [Rhodospirillaceae bacterium]|nr:MAG: carboxymuconolactone decarboxylase [Rhodospirillaceae bacterium]
MPLSTLHTLETAPEGSRDVLQAYQDRFGFVPNIVALLADSPAALNGYATSYNLLDESDFTPPEQQLIFLAVSVANKCTYCVAAHSMAGKMVGLDDQTINAVRDGTTVLDSKNAAIADFATKIVNARGFVSPDAINDFLAAGHTQAQILDVLLGVSTKTISNYANHIADTPLDEAFAPMAWTPPAENIRKAS